LREFTGAAPLRSIRVVYLGGVLGRHDEAKLMAISAAALHEGLTVSLVFESGISLAPLAIAGDPAPFEVAEMGVDGPTHRPPHLARSL
jgi:hypothetical protein